MDNIDQCHINTKELFYPVKHLQTQDITSRIPVPKRAQKKNTVTKRLYISQLTKEKHSFESHFQFNCLKRLKRNITEKDWTFLLETMHVNLQK